MVPYQPSTRSIPKIDIFYEIRASIDLNGYRNINIHFKALLLALLVGLETQYHSTIIFQIGQSMFPIDLVYIQYSTRGKKI